jgi:6-phosphogluconolactonase
MHTPELFDSADALAQGGADAVVAAAGAAVRRSGAFFWCLAGGSTPRALYALLASEAFAGRVAWDRVQVFFGDERCVPPDHPESNYRMAREALLAHVPVPGAQVHRIAGELAPEAGAAAYEATLRATLGVAADGGPARAFDLVLLGMGGDGHTASLFPGSVDEPGRWASARLDPAGALWRVSLLPLVLNGARDIRVLVTGAAKAERLAEVLEGPSRPDALPAQRVRPVDGTVTWMVDRAAAARLRPPSLAREASPRAGAPRP